MQKISGIYKITCLSNKKFYIGSSVDIKKRWNEHIWELNNGKHCNKHLQDAWNKYGQGNFKFEIIEKCGKNNILQKEQEYIDLYNVCDRTRGFNISKDALAPMKGRKHSKETRKNFSEVRKGTLKGKNNPMYGKHLTLEQKEHLRMLNMGQNNAFYGKKHTKEAKNKISIANKGRTVSEIQKQHLSITMLGENNPFFGKKHSQQSLNKMSKNRKGKCAGKDNPNAKKVVKLDEGNNLIEIYDTVTEAANKTNAQRSHIALVCRGERKHAGSYKWIYYEDYLKLNKKKIQSA